MTATTDDVDALIAAKIMADELFAELDAAFWRELAAIRKTGGVGVNEICRRVHAAGLGSKPTTLNKLAAAATGDLAVSIGKAGESIGKMSGQFKEATASLQRNAEVIRRMLAEAPDELLDDELPDDEER